MTFRLLAALLLTGLATVAGAPPAAAQQAAAQSQAGSGNEACLRCHGSTRFELTRPDGSLRSLSVPKEQFEHSVHGKAGIQCVMCHQEQADLPHKTFAKNASEWRLGIPNICANCHADKRDQWAKSVHGQEIAKGNSAAAVCSDCHSAHSIEPAAEGSTALAITRNCGNCHVDSLESYTNTFHGKVSRLGFAYTAKCADCHGSHDILRTANPQSRVHPNNRLETCQMCHVNATPGFVSFQPHATNDNLARYPHTWIASRFMLGLLGGTFAFFWTHTLLWFYREWRERQKFAATPHVRAPRSLGAAATAEAASRHAHADEKHVLRWPAGWRLAHLVFALSLMVLTFTGMTIFHADTTWAPIVSQALGGPAVTGYVHRIAAVIFAAVFIGHLVYVGYRIARNWRNFRWFGPTSLIPNLQDLKDIVAMFTWFFGRGPRPVFDRYTYWEKFDYWAPFWGVTIIGVSGAMLWFPEITAAYLPGWVFNVAAIAHGEEAVLAAGFLFTVHFFNNHFRPDKFPLDVVMFTGSMPLEEFKREHTLEYERLVAEGRLKDYLVEPPSPAMTIGSKILGFTLIAVGLILLFLVTIGFVERGLAG